ncbi:hypothetical protein SB782_33825, partial [Brevibacillus sp. SIMBA_076]
MFISYYADRFYYLIIGAEKFIDLFEEWSKSYDDTGGGHDMEYQDVIKHFDRLLESSSIRLMVTC